MRFNWVFTNRVPFESSLKAVSENLPFPKFRCSKTCSQNEQIVPRLVLIEFNLVLVRFNIVLFVFNRILVEFNWVLVGFNKVFVGLIGFWLGLI